MKPRQLMVPPTRAAAAPAMLAPQRVLQLRGRTVEVRGPQARNGAAAPRATIASPADQATRSTQLQRRAMQPRGPSALAGAAHNPSCLPNTSTTPSVRSRLRPLPPSTTSPRGHAPTDSDGSSGSSSGSSSSSSSPRKTLVSFTRTSRARGPISLYANLPSTTFPVPTINKLLSLSLSKGTWAGRSRTAEAFLRIRRDPLSSVDQLLEQRLATVAPSTVTKDIGHLKWILPRLLSKEQAEPLVLLLQDIQRGVRKVDPGRPLTKAIPLSLAELRRVLIAAPLPIRALAILAFRSASRISDLLHLRPRDVTNTKDGLLVTFSITKTNQEAERRADHRILVPDPPSDILRWCLANARSKTLWTETHRQQLTLTLQRMPPDPRVLKRWQEQDPQNLLRRHYTLHSFKRGAAALAWQGVVDGKITLQDLMLLLKHQDIKSALEYCPCPLLAAKAAGSTAAALTQI